MIENTDVKLELRVDLVSLPGVPAPGTHGIFAQVCSSRVTKEYRLSRIPMRIFVNPGVPTLVCRGAHLSPFGAQIGPSRGVDASFHEVYSELAAGRVNARSEEHTSELQSRPHLVCRLLLEKKKHAEQHCAESAGQCGGAGLTAGRRR